MSEVVYLSHEKDNRLQGVLCRVHGKIVGTGEEEDIESIVAV
jgi:hypothetical protein